MFQGYAIVHFFNNNQLNNKNMKYQNYYFATILIFWLLSASLSSIAQNLSGSNETDVNSYTNSTTEDLENSGFAVNNQNRNASPNLILSAVGAENVNEDYLKTITYGSAIGELPIPIKKGSKFKYWTIDGEIITSSTIWKHTTPKIANAQWCYVVTFNTSGGSSISSIDVDPNNTIQPPASPSKAGFLFLGWYKDVAWTQKWNFNIDKVDQETTLYAKWISQTSDITISFNTNGGSTVPSQTVKVGSQLTQPTSPTKAGVLFGGWYTSLQEQSQYNRWYFEKDKVVENITLYARWVNEGTTYLIRCFDNSDLFSSFSSAFNSLLSKPADPVSNKGLTFLGWMDDNRHVLWDFDKDRVIDNTHLSAQWVNALELFTITFDSNGGSPVAQQTVQALQLISQPGLPTKNNFIFEGWYKDPFFTSAWNFGSDKVVENITLYAKWNTTIVNKYTVTFNSNGGSSVASQTVNSDQLIIQPTQPGKSGSVFAGWYKDPDLTIVWDFGKDKVVDNITLYAKWNTGASNNYTVTFNTDGGSNVKTQNVVLNGLVSRPANPTKDGYTFGGWYKESSLTTAWNFSKDRVTNHIALYAKWNVVKFKVTFASNKGTAIEAITVDYNSIFIRPKDPVRSGYSFGGWYKESTLKNPWDFKNDKVVKNTTLYAKWAVPTSIITEEHSLKLYPNPATTELKIENIALTGAESIQIFDITGKQVLKVILGEVIDISSLPQGIYSVKAGKYTAKFIKR